MWVWDGTAHEEMILKGKGKVSWIYNLWMPFLEWWSANDAPTAALIGTKHCGCALFSANAVLLAVL